MTDARRILDKAMSEAELFFTFPLPPDELKVNRRMGQHWGAGHHLKTGYRTACELVVNYWKSGPGRWAISPVSSCSMTVTAYLGARQRCDPSDLGAWCKVPIDALVKKGVLKSDSSACIKSFTPFVERDAKNPRLEILLRGA